jgi:hypothetical protein
MEQLLWQSEKYKYAKIQEASPLHPIHSSNGLIGLSMVFYMEPILFVRSVRNLYDIFESFYATRLPGANNEGLKNYTDYDIYRYYINEAINTKLNILAIDKYRVKHNLSIYFVEVDYDKLDDDIYRKNICNKIANITGDDYYYNWICDTFRKKSVREGRLSMGVKKSLLSDKKKQEIKEFLERKEL